MKSLAVATCLMFVCVANGEDAASSDKPIWITVEQRTGQTGVFEIQFLDGEKFKLIDSIVTALPVEGNEVKLAPSSELPLAFDTDKFLVIKIDGKSLTLAPGSEMPLEVTRSVAGRLETEGYSGAVIRSPKELLQYIKPKVGKDPFSPKDPFNHSPFRKFAFRDRLTFDK